MVGGDGVQRYGGESEVGERGICVLGVSFQAIEGGVRGVGGVLLARGDETEKAGRGHGGFVGVMLLLLEEDGGEKDGDGLFDGGEGEGRGYGRAPELVAHG